jgi:transposase-like protein
MAMGMSRDRQREARWRGIIREQARSGLSIRAFCRQVGVTESAFYFWRGELARRGQEQRRRRVPRRRRPRATSPPAFVPVNVLAEVPAQAAGRMEIELPGGWRVRVAAPVDRSVLADVLAVLAEAADRPQARRADLSAAAWTKAEGQSC